MSEERENPNPDNPRCPICGAVDWFSFPQYDYMIHHAHRGTTRAVELAGSPPMMLPVEGWICRSCRFVRFRAPAGSLELPDHWPSA